MTTYGLKIDGKIVARHDTRSAAYADQEARGGKVVRLRPRDVLPGVPEGTWVILRGYRSGVNAGRLVAVRDGYMLLRDARKIWYWNGAAALPEIAVWGVKDKGGTKVCARQDSLPVQQSDVSEVLVMREAGIAWLKSVPEWSSR